MTDLLPEQIEAADVWTAWEQQKQRRAEALPTEDDCFAAMAQIEARLRDLGWHSAIYCPKDGTPFEAIEFGCGSSGRCFYFGDWPNGRWWMAGGGGLWPSRPVMFRPINEGEANNVK